MIFFIAFKNYFFQMLRQIVRKLIKKIIKEITNLLQYEVIFNLIYNRFIMLQYRIYINDFKKNYFVLFISF